MRRLTLVLLLAFVLGYATNCSCVHVRDTLHRTEFALADDDVRVKSAWSAAKKLGGVDAGWDQHPPVVIVRAIIGEQSGQRLLGRYISYIDVDRKGHVIPVEQILVYVLPHEDGKIPNILTHEFLHAIWQRKCTTDVQFRLENPDSEVWVCRLGLCQY